MFCDIPSFQNYRYFVCSAATCWRTLSSQQASIWHAWFPHIIRKVHTLGNLNFASIVMIDVVEYSTNFGEDCQRSSWTAGSQCKIWLPDPFSAQNASKIHDIGYYSMPPGSIPANCMLSERAWWAYYFDTKSIGWNHFGVKMHGMQWFPSFQPKFSPKHMNPGCDVMDFLWYRTKPTLNDSPWIAGSIDIKYSMVDQDSIEMQEKTCNFWSFWGVVDQKSASCPLEQPCMTFLNYFHCQGVHLV